MALGRRRFNFTHSLAGVALALVIETFFVSALYSILGPDRIGIAVILAAAIAGGLGIIVIATEVIREVHRALHMLTLLSAVVFEFIVFFAFQYLYLGLMAPASFPTLQMNPVNLMLHSTMIFALNPLHLPQTVSGEALLLINTLESVVMALFVLQNIWQFHREDREMLK